jgi:hypothetical protein
VTSLGHGLAAVTASAAVIAAPSLAAPGGSTPPAPAQTSAGPCNLVTVNVNAQDLSPGIIEGFTGQRAGKVGSLDVKDIKVYFLVNVNTGNLTCTTKGSASQVGQTNTLQTPTATEKPLRQDCSSIRACTAQGLVRLRAGGDARQRITVQTGGH